MLGLILAATLSQVRADDFYFIQAQENFVMDNAPKPVRYSAFIPKELCEQVDIWREDCARCRRNANTAVVSMGPGVIRWLFWPLRAKDLRVSLHAEACINNLISCPRCSGKGVCEGYEQSDPETYTCDRCGSLKYRHLFAADECLYCQGSGTFNLD